MITGAIKKKKVDDELQDWKKKDKKNTLIPELKFPHKPAGPQE